MRTNFLSKSMVLVVCILLAVTHGITIAYAAQPNIIIIVADDMGWGDLCADSNAPGFMSGPACNGSTYSYYCYKDTNITGNCSADSQCTSSNYATTAGCYRSNANTPRLDNLAQKGIRLTNFYSPAPICSPSRASLLTGRYPVNHGVSNEGSYLPTSEVTIAKALKELKSSATSTLKNYSTGMVGKWHLGWNKSYYPNERGFDYYYALPYGVYWEMGGFNIAEGLTPTVGGPTPNPAPLPTPPLYCTHPEMKVCNPVADSSIDFWCVGNSCSDSAKSVLYDGARKKSLTEIITDKAIEFISNPTNSNGIYRAADKPFFLYVALPSPHAPLDVHLPNNDGYELKQNSYGATGLGEACAGLDTNRSALAECAFKVQFMENYPTTESTYYSRVIKEIDTRVQEIIDAIPENEDTIIVFTSDNGTDMGIYSELTGSAIYIQNSTGGLKGAKRFVFEGGVRVPFIAYWKGSASTRQWPQMPGSSQLADLTDLFPTLLHAAELPDDQLKNYYSPTNSKPINGQDLIAFFTSGTPTSNDVQYYSTKPNVNQALFYQPYNSDGYYAPIYAYRKYSPDNVDGLNNFKLLFDPIYNPNNQIGSTSRISENFPFYSRLWELYDLAGDPREGNNVVKDYTPVITYACNDLNPNPSTCQKDVVGSVKFQQYRYFLPSIKDNDSIGWENYISVKAISNDVSMGVTFHVYNLAGGDPVKSYTTTVAPKDRVNIRPSWITGSVASPVPIEGSVIIETSVPAIVSTNTMAWSNKGFSINEAAKPRAVQNFSKALDGTAANNEAYLLVQNIYDETKNITIEMANGSESGCNKIFSGLTNTVKTFDALADNSSFGLKPHSTLKIRPSDLCPAYNDTIFNGSININSSSPMPAVCRYEAAGTNKENLAIYESTVSQHSLYFPHLKDEYSIIDNDPTKYRNYLSVVNSSSVTANFRIILYNNSGIAEACLEVGASCPTTIPVRITDPQFSEGLPPNGKLTQQPSKIKESNFEGSAIVISNIPVVGQTNIMYPDYLPTNAFNADAFELFESAIPNSSLFFPKAYDNILACAATETNCINTALSARLFENYVYIQNPDEIPKNILIEQFNNNGAQNGKKDVFLDKNETYVYRPKDIVVDYSGQFRGYIKIKEKDGKPIAGAMKYENRQYRNGVLDTVDAMTLYRAMGQ